MIPTTRAETESTSPQTPVSKDSRSEGNVSDTPRTWTITTAGSVLAVLGAAIFISWGMYLAQGFLTDGLLTIKNNSYVIVMVQT